MENEPLVNIEASIKTLNNNEDLKSINTNQIKKGEEILTWWGENYYNSWCSAKK